MGLLTRTLQDSLGSLRSQVLGPLDLKDKALVRLFGGRPSSTGERVTIESATGQSVAWAAIALLSGAFAMTATHVYRRGPDGARQRIPEHQVEKLLTFAANRLMTAAAFKEALVTSLLVAGWAVAEIEWAESGQPFALWPLHPHDVVPFDAGGQIRYRVTAGGRQRELGRDDLLIVMGPHSLDGIVPVAPIERLREPIGVAQASGRYAGSFFRNGATPSGVLSHPKTLSATAHANLRDSWREAHQGVDAAHHPAILEEGLTWTSVEFTPEQSQILESRRFSVEELARVFGNVPPSMVGAAIQGSGLSYRNVEDEGLRFVLFSLGPIVKRIENAMMVAFVSPLERLRMYVETDFSPLLRTDLAGRYAAYKVGKDGGWLSADEIREKENMAPLPNGAGKTYTSTTTKGGPA